MAFIPIDAKADVQGSKKGKLTPAQHAQLNAWCLARKTGILDCLDKCIYDSERTSFIPSNNKVTVVFKKGYVVICGRLVECEEGSTVEVTTPVVGSVTGKIILRYNLASSQNGEFEVTTTTSDLVQNDLNSNTNGKYEFELYTYIATSSNVSLTRNMTYIPNMENMVQNLKSEINGTINKVEKSIESNINDLDKRLTALGFKEGSVTLSSGTATTNKVTRQGNYVIGNINVKNLSHNITSNYTMMLPANFRPKSQLSFVVGCGIRVVSSGGSSVLWGKANITIETNGVITLKEFSFFGGQIEYLTEFNINFGFEANPIK